MNCPSRTDDTLPHCDWNQNPPFLAPDLTTRQDLNGISNAREYRPGIGFVDISRHHLHGAEFPTSHKSDCDESRYLQLRASLTQSARPNNKIGTPQSSYDKVKSWSVWLLSVLSAAVFLSASGLIDKLAGVQSLIPYLLHMNMDSYISPSEFDDVSATKAARSYAKRQTCAQGGVDSDVYNTSLHVGALFIILGVSTLACALPILIIRFSRLRIPAFFLFFVRHFGTGVLIATAFVHLLPTAFTLLGDPCLSGFWTTDYPAMPGAISLGGIFLVTLIEMVFSPVRHATRRSSKQDDREHASETVSMHQPPHTVDISGAPNPHEDTRDCDQSPHLRPKGPLLGRSSSFGRAIHRIEEESNQIYRISSAPEASPVPQARDIKCLNAREGSFQEEFQLSEKQRHNKDVMQVFMLEVGILFHSVFIGMSLSVSVGNEFVILMIAIVFHQTFEGLALGSRIACLEWPTKAAQPWLMSLAYGCTTPIGQAIGIATHSLYSPGSEIGLLLVGTMNAISAGLLIFASLVELMSEDFLSDESWRVLRGRRRVIACVLVFLGAFCMSVVGAWA